MSDKNKVLAWLKSGRTITPAEAYESFGCLRLGARIWDLRHEGYCISTTIIQSVDRNGEPCRYARYKLVA